MACPPLVHRSPNLVDTTDARDTEFVDKRVDPSTSRT
jgi:hypothetical protein